MKNIQRLFYCGLYMLFSAACKEAYQAPVKNADLNYLVIEGYINSNGGVTKIMLSRTARLTQTTITREKNAQLTIESDANESFPMSEAGDGTYLSQSLTLANTAKYRLRIKTKDGKEYLSDFTAVKSTPPIDSINWVRQADGVQLHINTHDPQNNTKYYYWNYEETWEFHSTYTNSLVYVVNPDTHEQIAVTYKYPDSHDIDTTIYKCWKTVNSTDILIGSSEKLSEDKIFLPLLFIPQGSEKISVLYSVRLNQIAVSKEAYQFLQKMKKNTEQLGSIFDAQPTELKGNIHCISNPDELVIGFVEVSQQQDKRIFISNRELPRWDYNSGCDKIDITNNKDSIAKYAGGRLPSVPSETRGSDIIVSFFASAAECIDCTVKGTNVKPDFWP